MRVLHLVTPDLDADMSAWGVQAMEILAGRLSFLFPGQLHAGNLEAWAAAPWFWLLGPSPLLLCLFPFAVSLGMLWLVWRLARQELGDWGGLAALAWTALPPFVLTYHSVTPRGAYIEVPFLIVLSFLLTLRLARGQGGARLAGGLGLVWGLGLWLHLLMAPALAACGLYLLWRRPSLPRPSRLGPLLLGVLLGGLPLWGAWLAALPGHEFEMQASLHSVAIDSYWPAWEVFWGEYLPLLLGRPDWPLPAWLEALAGPALALLYGLVALAALAGSGRALWTRSDPRAELLRLSLLFLACFLATWIAKGAYFQFHTWRHLVIMYGGLPLVFGAGIAQAARWRPALALGLALAAVGINLAGSLNSAHLTRPDLMAAWQEKHQQRARLLDWLEREGHGAVYCDWYWETMPLNLQAAGKIVLADFKTNIIASLKRRADAGHHPAWVVLKRRSGFAALLDLAGITYRRTELGPYQVFDRLALPGPGVRELDPASWQGQGGQTPAEAWDRDLSTAWTTGAPQRPGQSLVVDLGQVQEGLCQVLLHTSLPGKEHDAPRGIEVHLSLDGRAWQKAAGADDLYGHLDWCLDRPLLLPHPPRLLIRFAPRAARWLKLVQTGRDDHYYWSLAELRAFAAAGPALPPPRAQDLARALDQLSPGLPVYAPPQVRALMPEKRDALIQARLHHPPWSVELEPGALLCMPASAWTASLPLLKPFLEAAPQVEPVGNWVAVRLPPLASRARLAVVPPPKGTKVSTDLGPEMAPLILDGNPATRWHGTQAQRPGQRLTITLGQPLTLAGLELDPGPWAQDYPRGLDLELSPDGRAWRSPSGLRRARGALLWTGDRLMLGQGPARLRFAPQPVAALRLTQTGRHARYHWSLAELRLLSVP